MSEKIKCPKCSHEFELSEAMTKDLRAEFNAKYLDEKTKLEEKYKGEYDRKEQNLRGEITIEIEQKNALRITELLAQIKANNAALMEMGSKLQQSEIEKTDLLKAKSDYETKLNDMKRANDEIIRKKTDELRVEAEIKVKDEFRLKEAEHTNRIADLLKQIDEMKTKAEQGSQRDQGEVLEDELLKFLTAAYPMDSVSDVPVGVSGADLIQRSRLSYNDEFAGTIIWEAKRTKKWMNDWISKLKKDQIEAKADIAVIVTQTLPEEISNFGRMNGVWITDYKSVAGLSVALRHILFEVARAKGALVNQDSKMQKIYDYICGQEFRQRMAALYDAFKKMNDELNQERTSMERIWKKREKTIKDLMTNTTRVWNEMGSLTDSLPDINSVKLLEQTEG